MKIPKKSFPGKKIFKHASRKCAICEESEYDLLDTHRWKTEGCKGGKYSLNNSLCLCTSCHRLIHTGKITIIGIHESTAGKIINFTDKNDKEQIKKI